jgi:hypothetical protein
MKVVLQLCQLALAMKMGFLILLAEMAIGGLPL